MDINISYEPNAKQAIFHECPADEVVYGGAKGGGKSCALVMEALAYALENPGADMYIFRETYDDLEANIIQEWKAKVPKELYTYNEGKHIATLINGTTVKFRYIRNFKDAEGYQGRSMDWIGVDELTKHEEKSIQVLLSCLRSPKGFKPTFRGTCNPGGIGHGWVKQKYILATNHGEKTIEDPVTGNGVAFIPAKVYDNTVLMQNDPAYVRRLENLPEEQKKAFLHGDWDVFIGQYFQEWRRDKHVVQPFHIPSHWKRFRSIDWGYNDPCAIYWHAIAPDSRIYTYRELYINQTLASEVAAKVNSLSKNERIEYTVMSPDAWAKRGGDNVKGESIAEIMQNAGLFVEKADNDRINGWMRMHEYLADAPDGLPRWQIFSTCTNLIRTLPELIHDEHNVEDVSDKCEDHAPESCRYALMSRPSPVEAEITTAIALHSSVSHDEMFKKGRHWSEIEDEADEEDKWMRGWTM